MPWEGSWKCYQQDNGESIFLTQKIIVIFYNSGAVWYLAAADKIISYCFLKGIYFSAEENSSSINWCQGCWKTFG